MFAVMVSLEPAFRELGHDKPFALTVVAKQTKANTEKMCVFIENIL
jgi:hypothetical protein